MGLIGKLVGTAVLVGTLGAGVYFFRGYAAHSSTIQRYLGNTRTAEQLDEAQLELTNQVTDSTTEAARDISDRLGEWRGEVRKSWGEYKERAAEARQVEEEVR